MSALAAESERPFEGRLAGTFAYTPPPTERRGPAGPATSPDVVIAAARIEKRAGDANSVRLTAASGAAALVTGNFDRAIELLGEAVEREPGNAAFQNDLAVAHSVRARARARAEDWIQALAAAGRALALDPRRPEPHFNRAVAFGGLSMATEEADAWQAFLRVESVAGWSDESRSRIDAVRRRQEQAVAASQGPDNQRLREGVEDDLSRWGAAVEKVGTADAAALLGDARRLATELVRAGGDTMPADEIARIDAYAARGQAGMVRRLAAGHRLYGEARRAFTRDRFLEMSDLMAAAASQLQPAGSPYSHFAAVMRAIFLRNDGHGEAAVAHLRSIPIAGLPASYYHLRARAPWMESLAQENLGRYDVARGLMTQSLDLYRLASEHDNRIATLTNLAEIEWFLGDRARAWTSLTDALVQIDRRRSTRRAHFDLAATMASESDLPEAALEFHDARARLESGDTNRARTATALRRARTLIRAGRTTEAREALTRAADGLPSVDDPALFRRYKAEIDVAETELFSRLDCRRAMDRASAALTYLRETHGTIRLARVLTARARCHQASGNAAMAKADLQEALTAFEDRRAVIATAADRVQAFLVERAAFRDLIALDAVTLGDQAAALRTAERTRAGVLAERWDLESTAPRDRRALPADLAVVYYVSLTDRVLVWVLTREAQHTFSRPIGDADLALAVKRIHRLIQRGGNLSALAPHSSPLFDAIVAPALALADGVGAPKSRIVFVPDGALFALPFGALPDGMGRALLETRTVGLAPSLRTFLAASARLDSFRPLEVLAVGDGHDAESTGLPMLPRADGEAIDVASIYPRRTVLVGADATKRRFLATRANVVHFAGHSVLNEQYPALSRMLFAPERGAGESGSLLGTEIAAAQFGGTSVVVLASCEGAAGHPLAGEGAISIGRAFFAAGVPAVLASLWPVDDDLQTLMRTLHRTLVSERDAARALRAGQLALLAERGRSTPVRVWGGFTMLGGMTDVPSDGRTRD